MSGFLLRAACCGAFCGEIASPEPDHERTWIHHDQQVKVDFVRLEDRNINGNGHGHGHGHGHMMMIEKIVWILQSYWMSGCMRTFRKP